MRTQETLESKRKGETCHHKRIRNSRRRQHILGRIDVKHSWDHPANVRLLNIRSFLGGDSFCRPCHLIYVHSLATRPNSHPIHRGQSSLQVHGSNLWHQSEEISHRQWNFSEEGFKSNVSDNNQTISYCGVGAHFQNRISEAAIKELT